MTSNTMTFGEELIQRCKASTFPGSVDLVAAIDTGAVFVLSERPVDAIHLLSNVDAELKTLPDKSAPVVQRYKDELLVKRGVIAKRPSDRFVTHQIQFSTKPLPIWWVYEWQSDRALFYASEIISPAALDFSRWRWANPPGVNELIPPWVALADKPEEESRWLDPMWYPLWDSFFHALTHMTADERRQWTAANPPPNPKWRERIEWIMKSADGVTPKR